MKRCPRCNAKHDRKDSCCEACRHDYNKRLWKASAKRSRERRAVFEAEMRAKHC